MDTQHCDCVVRTSFSESAQQSKRDTRGAHLGRALGWLVMSISLAACAAPGTRLFRRGPQPVDLVGTWLDSARATAVDSVAWVLAPSGAHGRLHITVARDPGGKTVVTRNERGDGQWYLSGALGDSNGRAFCVSRRARSAPTCVPFRLDTIRAAGTVPRRRLTILERRHEKPLIVLLERLP